MSLPMLQTTKCAAYKEVVYCFKTREVCRLGNDRVYLWRRHVP